MSGAAPDFPPGFLWGAATAAHQVEGGNRLSDWWAMEESGALPFRSGDACDHYRRFAADFDLARDLGHTAHRFSLEWSRIEPAPGVWDPDAIAHYRSVVLALRQRGLEPLVTLHHFTNPRWFAERGGWLRRDAAALFTRYVERMAGALPEVAGLLNAPDPAVRLHALRAVGRMGAAAKGAVPDLAKLVDESKDVKVAVEAALALHRLDPANPLVEKRGVPLLLEDIRPDVKALSPAQGRQDERQEQRERRAGRRAAERRGHFGLRRGRRTSSPPQFGQTRSNSPAHASQNVHSKLQTYAVPSWTRPAPQRSQVSRISRATTRRPARKCPPPVRAPASTRTARGRAGPNAPRRPRPRTSSRRM